MGAPLPNRDFLPRVGTTLWASARPGSNPRAPPKSLGDGASAPPPATSPHPAGPPPLPAPLHLHQDTRELSKFLWRAVRVMLVPPTFSGRSVIAGGTCHDLFESWLLQRREEIGRWPLPGGYIQVTHPPRPHFAAIVPRPFLVTLHPSHAVPPSSLTPRARSFSFPPPVP